MSEVKITCIRCGHVSTEVKGVYDRNGDRKPGYHWDGTLCKAVKHGR